MKYTEKFHAKRLIKLLEKKDICGRELCPAQKCFSGDPLNCAGGYDYWGLNVVGQSACDICKEFVGAKLECPCHYFGGDKAIKRTVSALKKKGYL